MSDNRDRELAILGGAPLFETMKHVGRPNIPARDRFQELVEGLLDRAWLTNNGPLVQEFEHKLCTLTGVRNVIAVSNATVGIEILVRALGIEGEVIVPSYTFVATAHALKWMGIEPVFSDIDPVTHCLDPALIERSITPRTRAILATHLWGGVCDVKEIESIADRHGLQLMFDSAHAFGCSRLGRYVGSFGLAEVFSFHATKFLNTFEGGAIATNDDALANRIRLMRNFGFAGYDSVAALGTNGKMAEINAAMGLANLERLDLLLETNRRNFEAYREGLRGIDGLSLWEPGHEVRSNYQYIVCEVSAKHPLSRDELLKVLLAENIFARRYFWPCCHRMEPYASSGIKFGERLPVTERVAASVIVLPTGMAMTMEDIEAVCGCIRLAAESAGELRKKGCFENLP